MDDVQKVLGLLREKVNPAPEIKDRQLQVLGAFTLAWSYFEHKHCGGYANFKAIRAFSRSQAVVPNIDAPFQYFVCRYSKNCDAADKLAKLFKRESSSNAKKHENCLVSILQDTSPSDPRKTYAVLLITYRLRNNLFHGNKWPHLKIQLEPVEKALAALCEILENNEI